MSSDVRLILHARALPTILRLQSVFYPEKTLLNNCEELESSCGSKFPKNVT